MKSLKEINMQKWSRMRLILDALKQKPMSSSEIKQLIFKNSVVSKIGERTLQRYIEELKALGLIQEENGKYVWIEHKQVYGNLAEYKAALEHSRGLFEKITRDHIIGSEGDLETIEYLMQIDMWNNPGYILDSLVADREKHGLLLQHLAYYEEFWRPFQAYYELMQRYDFPRVSVPGEDPRGRVTLADAAGWFMNAPDLESLESPDVTDKVIPLPIIVYKEEEYILGYHEPDNAKTASDFRELAKLRSILVKELLYIMHLVEHGNSVEGSM